MRRAALVLLVALVLAGCTHPARDAPATAGLIPPTRSMPTRPAGWKAVDYRGLSFFVPATWRVRDGRKLPCPGMLPGPAVVLGHSSLRPPCPIPRLRTPLLWVDHRADEQPPAMAAATTINGLAVQLLRLHPDNLGQGVGDELLYWNEYRRGGGFQAWVPGLEVKAELLDPEDGAVVDQVLGTLHRS